MERLTAEQSQVLDFLKRERQVNISGCAGSGKTLVAVETANRLDRAGFKVLFLCHNPYLAEDIRSRVAGSGIVVDNIAAYIESILNDETSRAGTLLFNEPRRIKSWTDKDKSWTQFDSPSPYQLRDAIVKLSKKADRFDAVIIDEGQDFHPDWWEIIEASLKEPVNGIIYLFFDDHQANDPFGSHFKLQPHIALTKNYRNSGEILELVSKLYADVPETNQEVAGQGVVEEYIFQQEQELFDKIRAAFISAERFSPHLKDIVVISADPVSINENKLNGLVIDTPRLKSEGYQVGIDWQIAVIKYLKGYGLAENALSRSAIPAEKDVKAVIDFCRKKGRPLDKPPVHWYLDRYGRLSLHWDADDEIVNDEKVIRSFFCYKEWAICLPSAHKRYRLTTVEDFQKHPFYFNVRLTDIPSFKGLESEGVVFVFNNFMNIHEYHLKSSLYIGLSRARHWLSIVAPYSIIQLTKA